MIETRYLLDTNIVVGYFADDRAIASRITAGIEIYFCAPVIGELLFGAYHSARATANIARIEALMQGAQVLGCTRETARHYAAIRYDLVRRGTPIPENDLWIAAIARQHQLTVVTRDAHFSHLQSVHVEQW